MCYISVIKASTRLELTAKALMSKAGKRDKRNKIKKRNNKMKKITNKEASFYVSERLNFKGSNLKGQCEGKFYVVYSYDAPIFMFCSQTKLWYETDKHYSKTTSRHKNQVRPFPNVIKSDFSNLKEYINETNEKSA